MEENRIDRENSRAVGGYYETLAALYLRRAGLTILEHSWRNRRGEIDLIAMDGACLVFVEVKYRSSRRRGDPLESVTPAKQARIRRTAACYLYAKQKGAGQRCRFDVIAFLGGDVRWIKNAF